VKILESQVNFNRFIQKEDLNSLGLCIALTVGLTEIFKIILPVFEPRILVLIFSTLISYTKMYLNNGITANNKKEKILIAFFNVIPIAIGAIGSYDMILKIFIKVLGEG
jgi:hypothetical protein